MTQTNNADGLNTLADAAPSEKLVGAQPGADSQSAEPDESDDGVEALIVSMDRTTAEHLFLRAQRRI